MKINKNIFFCALLVLMLLVCVNAASAEEPLNETLGADSVDEVVVAEAPVDELSASGDTLVVDANGGGQYTSISDAVSAATGGETILVKNGQYVEAQPVSIGKSLSIVGESRENVIISGGSNGVFTNPTDDLTLDIMLKDLTIKDVTCTGSYAPVRFYYADINLDIINCTFVNCDSKSGAMQITTTTANIDGCKILNSKDSQGGSSSATAIAFTKGGTYTMKNCVIDGASGLDKNNYAAVYFTATSGTLDIDNLTIVNCQGAHQSLIRGANGNKITIKNSVIANNTINRFNDYNQNALFFVGKSNGELNIEQTIIANNTFQDQFVRELGTSDSTININYCNIYDNSRYTHNQASSNYDVEANYWGSNDLPADVTATTWVVEDNGEYTLNTGDALAKDIPGLTGGDEPGPEPATYDVYVSPSGDDGNDGSSMENAVKTIGKAYELAPVGGSIFISSGEYVIEAEDDDFGTGLGIDKSVSFVGESEDSTVIVLSNGVRFIIKDAVDVSFSHISFVDGAEANVIFVLDINELNIDNCKFEYMNLMEAVIQLEGGEGNVNINKNFFNSQVRIISIYDGTYVINANNNIFLCDDENVVVDFVGPSTGNFNYNYYGKNTKTTLGGNFENTYWVISNVTADPTGTVETGDEVEVTVSFNQFTDGTTVTSQSDLIPDGLTIKFSAAGDLTDESVVVENGIAKTTYTSDVAREDKVHAKIGYVEIGSVDINVIEPYKGIIYVNATGSDDNVGSIDAPVATVGKAVELALVDGGSGEIIINEGTYVGNGYQVTKDLTVTGVGEVTLDANNEGGLFSTGYPTDATKIELNNLTLTNAIGYGAAVNSYANELILNNVTIVNTQANGYLIKSNGKLTIKDSYIAQSMTGDVIQQSGAGDILIENSVFENNVATDGSSVYAVIDLNSGNGNLVVKDSKFINNTVKQGVIRGYSSYNINVTGSEFVDNTNTWGGGAIYAYMYGCTLDVTDSKFIRNTAGRDGGAIYIGWKTTANIDKSVFINNTVTGSGYYGDAIYNANLLTVTNSVLLTNGNKYIIYNIGDSATAQNNWWGTNDNPKDLVASGYDDYEEEDYPEVDVSNWVTMDASFTPEDAQAGEEVTVTATFSNANLPDGINVTFTSTSGNLNTVVSTVGAQASTTYTIDENDKAINATSTNAVIVMPISNPFETNIVTQDNFYNFFDESGNLLDTVPFDELIFQGEFSDLASYITIDRALTITGDGAVLNDIGFIIAGEGITLDNMELVANSDLGNLIDIAGENAVIKNMNITYVVSEAASAITVRPYANSVQILNNNIYFESTVDDYASDEVTTAICVNSGVSVFDDEDPIEGLVIDGNNITVVIPAFLADVYENEYYVMGLSAVNGVRFNGAKEFEFTNNKLDVTTNRLARTTPTLQALYVASSSGLIDGNNISMIDTFTPAGKDVYLYAVELINDEELTISNNNFNLSTTGGKADAGSAYAILAIASEFDLKDNNITTVSNGPNLGIYFPSRMGAPCDAVISGNFINVTGLATSEHDTGLVSGIEIQTGTVEITDNTIYTYNIGEYAEGNYIYGISYAQDGSAPEVQITENTIYAEGHYAISFLEVDDAKITDNYLISTDLFGDGAVEIKEGEGFIVKDNLPTNVVTNDTFYNFFDENGNLLDTVPFDELIFNGTFSDLTDMIVINRPVSVISENAVLDNIAIRIASNDVSLSGFTLNADKEFADNNGALIYATGANIEISDVVANYVAPSEAEAIAIYANAAENFTLVTSEIIFEATNPGSNHNYGLEVRDSNNANIEDNIITAVLPSVDVSWNGNGIDADLVLAVGIQGGNNVNFTANTVDVTTNGGVGYYPTIDAVMIHSTNNVLVNWNNITHIDTTTSDTARYYYSVDLHNLTGIVENNNLLVNTTSGIDRSGTAYPIQLTGPFTVTVNNNNLTSISRGPNAGIYASNWNGPGVLTVRDNNINVTGYATAGGYALVAGIEGETDLVKVYNNTINVYNLAEYADTNPVYGVSMTSSYMSAAPVADIKDNTITVDGKYAVYYASAENTNVTDNTLYAHEFKGDDAAAIDSGDNNIIENNLPAKANITIDAVGAWIGGNATVTVSVPNATGTVTIEINNKSYVLDLVDGVATKEIPAEDLIMGENIVTATYDGPEFASNTNNATFGVVDGVVTQDTYLLYFNQDDNGRLFDYIPDGATLDFQGSIINPNQTITVQMNVNKPVNIISSTKDAYVDLNTTAGSLLGESPGNSFAITYGGSGTNVSDVHFHNTQLWFSNTHNVVLDNISNVVEDQRVGSGVGATSIRDNSTNVLLKNSYFYTRNNGGSTTFTMSWATNCTIDNCTVKAEGNVGNLIYLNIFNVAGAPSGVPLNNYNTVSNNKIYGKEGSAISVGLMVEGTNNLIVNNTLYKSSISTSFGGVNPANNTYVGNVMTDGSGLTAHPYSIIYGNNVTGALSTGKGSVAYDNVVGGKLTVGQDATVYNNTVGNGLATGGTNAVIENNTIAGAVTINKVGTTFVGNNVTGTVTVSANDNVIKGNNITSAGNYSVDLGAKTGNNVTDNYLVGALYKGDVSVKHTNANNVIENNTPLAPIAVEVVSVWMGNNSTVTVTVANTTGTVTVVVNGKNQTVELVDGVATVEVAAEDLVLGENDVTVTYNGPEYAPITVDDAIVVVDGVVTQDTYLYYFNQDDAGKFFDYIPEGATLDFQGSIINPDQSIKIWFNVNKPVNIVSTTNDAYIDLNTTAGSLLGENPGNRFTVSYGGSGSNITGLNFHNTQLWIANTHHVVLDNISNVIEDQRVGSGVGATSVRENCTYVTVKNSYFYTRNNGGSSSLVMAWADYCTFDNNTIEVEGNVGNMIYLTTFNVNVPSGVVANVHNNITNNYIFSPNNGAAICWALVLSGSDNLIENNTIEYKGVGITTQYGSSASPNNTYRNNVMLNGSSMSVLPDSVLYNNTISGALTVGARSIAYNNTVGGKLNIAQGAYAYNNTVAGGLGTTGTDSIIENNTIVGAVTINKVGTTFVGNNVTGTVTISANDNVIKENTVISTGNYAVDLGAKTGNNVTDNYLVGALYKGDAAVKFSNANNIVENNRPYVTVLDVTVVNATTLTNATITVTSNAEGVVSIKVGDVFEADNVTIGEEFTLPVLPAGVYDVIVTYEETENYLAAVNDTEKLEIVKETPEITVTADDIAYGDILVVDVELPAGVLAVNVTVGDETQEVALTEGKGSAEFTGLGAGTYDVVASFAGDDTYNEASAETAVIVNKATPTISVSADNIKYGEDLVVNVELSGDVARRAIVTVGNETKYASLTDGVGSVKFSGLAAGTYTVVASYNGDVNYGKFSANTTVKVNRGTPSIKVSTSSIHYGDDLVVNVKLSDDVARRAIVTVGNETKLVSLTNGTGSVKFSGLAVGTYDVIVSYNGDSNYAKSSANKTVHVYKGIPNIKVTTNPVCYGENLVVAIELANATRRVNVMVDNETKLVTLTDGVGSAEFSGLTIGTHNITVTYNGDDNYSKTTVNSTVKVKRATPEIQVTADDITVGEALTVNVQLPADVTKRANVVIGNESKAVRLTNGSGSVDFTGLEVGTYEIEVSYAGDAHYGKASTITTIEVKE